MTDAEFRAWMKEKANDPYFGTPLTAEMVAGNMNAINSDTQPKADNPFKTTGPRRMGQTTQDIRQIVQNARDAEMTPYATDAALWTREARGRLANIVRSHGIVNDTRITNFVNDVFQEIEDNEQGDFQALRRHLILDLRADRIMKRKSDVQRAALDADKKHITSYAAERGLTVVQSTHIVRQFVDSSRKDKSMTVAEARALVDAQAAKNGKVPAMPVSDILREAFPESAAKLDAQEAENAVWSFVTETDPSAQEQKAIGHLLRELKTKDKTVTYANIGYHIVTALGKSVGLSIIQNGTDATKDALQIYVENYNAEIAPKTGEIEASATPIPETTIESEKAPMNAPETVKENSVSQLPESPFSANFKLIHATGVEVQFTIRAESGAVGIPKVEGAITYLLENGYTSQRQAPVHTSGNGAATPSQPTQSSGAGGVATCVMISVGESYQGGKTQLNFDCDGMEFPLKFTKPDQMVKLLRNVTKMDGTPFTDADLTVGRKFPGQWNVKWSQSDKYRNVDAVSAAA